MSASGIEPKRLRLVCPRAEAAPSLVLVEGRRGGKPGLKIEPPLILSAPEGGESRKSGESTTESKKQPLSPFGGKGCPRYSAILPKSASIPVLELHKLLGQVHIVLMGVVKALHLGPESADLIGTVPLDLLQRRQLIHKLAFFKHGDLELNGPEILHELPLPAGLRVADLQRLGVVHSLVAQADIIGPRPCRCPD